MNGEEGWRANVGRGMKRVEEEGGKLRSRVESQSYVAKSLTVVIVIFSM